MRIEDARIGQEVVIELKAKIVSLRTDKDGTTAKINWGGIGNEATFPIEYCTPLEEPKEAK